MRTHLQEKDSLRRDRNRDARAKGFVRADTEPSSQSRLSPRSRRFPIETPIYYRKRGSSHWQEGRTLNISESGVLFGAKQAPAPRTTVEMTFSLPVEGRIEAGGQVICHGEIVRNSPSAGSNGLQDVAATIVRYRLERSTTRREH